MVEGTLPTHKSNLSEDQAKAMHRALIACMTVASAADNQLKPVELRLIGSLAAHLPVFADFDLHNLPIYVEDTLHRLKTLENIEPLLIEIREKLPVSMYETAYALAVDMVAADLKASEAELNFLQILRQILGLDRLICAGIERGARARVATP